MHEKEGLHPKVIFFGEVVAGNNKDNNNKKKKKKVSFYSLNVLI